MVRVVFWPFLPFVVFLLMQSDRGSAQCSELQRNISFLENELLNITEQKQKYGIFLDTCYVSSTLLLLFLRLWFVTKMQDRCVVH
jgi:hypothetical protein